MNGFYTKVKSFFELDVLFGLSTCIWLITCVKMNLFFSNLRKSIGDGNRISENGWISSYRIGARLS